MWEAEEANDSPLFKTKGTVQAGTPEVNQRPTTAGEEKRKRQDKTI